MTNQSTPNMHTPQQPAGSNEPYVITRDDLDAVLGVDPVEQQIREGVTLEEQTVEAYKRLEAADAELEAAKEKRLDAWNHVALLGYAAFAPLPSRRSTTENSS